MIITLVSRNGIAMHTVFRKKSPRGRPKYLDKIDLLRKQTTGTWKSRWKLPHFSVISLTRQRAKLGAALIMLAALLLIGTFLSLSEMAGRSLKGLTLPEEESVIENKLLIYASTEVEAQGSGDINLSELPVVRSVHTK